jgi:pentatricopeptide repeat protein
VNDAVTWIDITCDDAHLPDELIATCQAFGSRLAALPPCGECGDLTTGCLGGGACTRANLTAGAAWAPSDVDFDAGDEEAPELVERRARAVLPLLARERDPASYVRLGAELGGRLVAWGRVDDALAIWHEMEALGAAKRYADAAEVAEPAFEAARRSMAAATSPGRNLQAEHRAATTFRRRRLRDQGQEG